MPNLKYKDSDFKIHCQPIKEGKQKHLWDANSRKKCRTICFSNQILLPLKTKQTRPLLVLESVYSSSNSYFFYTIIISGTQLKDSYLRVSSFYFHPLRSWGSSSNNKLYSVAYELHCAWWLSSCLKILIHRFLETLKGSEVLGDQQKQ